MRKTLLFISFVLLLSNCRNSSKETSKAVTMNPISSQDPKVTLSPDERFGELFDSVMVNNVFEDTKTFLDLIPASPTEQTLAFFKTERQKPNFNWQIFMNQAFTYQWQKFFRHSTSNPGKLTIADDAMRVDSSFVLLMHFI